MPDQFGEKNHEATPHRRQQARKQGHVANSLDLSSAAVLLGAVLALALFGTTLVNYFGWVAKKQLADPPRLTVNVDAVVSQWNSHMTQLSHVLLPFFAMLVLVAIGINVLQIGFLVVPQKLAPDLQRIDPWKGLQRILSPRNFVRMALGVLKIAAVATAGGSCLWAEHEAVLGLGALEVHVAAVVIVQLLLKTCTWIGVTLLALAIIDFGFQRWKYEQDLRMTSQEVREEMKTLQGDPHLVDRRRQLQRQLAGSRTVSGVPQADVVIVDPSESTVAIRYDERTMEAPVVAAKGAGQLAERIRELAQEHHVPIVERDPLARVLFHTVEVQHPIPTDQYPAVAEVLRDAHQANGTPPLARKAA